MKIFRSLYFNTFRRSIGAATFKTVSPAPQKMYNARLSVYLSVCFRDTMQQRTEIAENMQLFTQCKVTFISACWRNRNWLLLLTYFMLNSMLCPAFLWFFKFILFSLYLTRIVLLRLISFLGSAGPNDDPIAHVLSGREYGSTWSKPMQTWDYTGLESGTFLLWSISANSTVR